MTRTALGGVLLLVLLAGCGDRDPSSSAPDRPSTSRALAYLAAAEIDPEIDHAGPAHGLTAGQLGAELRVHTTGESDGDAVYLAVDQGPRYPRLDDRVSQCQDLDPGRGGAKVQLCWQEVEPEEDPGYVVVSETRSDQRVTALLSGPDITGDPRRLDLFLPVDAMVRLVDDPRVGLRTTQEVLDASRDFRPWGDLP